MATRGERYEAICQDACDILKAALQAIPHLRDLDALQVWEEWRPLDKPVVPGIDSEITWLMWSMAHAEARLRLNLPEIPIPGGDVAYVFPMSDDDALSYFKRLVRQ